MDTPLPPSEAKRLVRQILLSGRVVYTMHCKDRMAERDVTVRDIENTLRGGVYGEPEWESEAWRYRAWTTIFEVVFEFDDDTVVIIVSTWRKS
jgi:hypothetical protein